MSATSYLSSSALLLNLPWLLVAFIIIHLLSQKFKPGLNRIPGPKVAAFTNLLRFFVTWTRRPEVVHQKLHARYGDAVRLGPNMVSISDWKAVKEVYGFNAAYIKSDFYPVQRAISNGKVLQSLFNTTDNSYHAKLRKGIASTYALIRELDQRYVDNSDLDGVCDLGTWLHYFAFDVIGELLFTKRLGFLENATDVEGIIANVGTVMSYISVVGQMPWIDKLLLKNPIRIWMSAHGIGQKAAPMPAFAAKRIVERLADKDSRTRESSNLPPDILDRFLILGQKDPNFFDNKLILGLMVGNVFGGSDSTAITIRTVFYHLLKSPGTMEALLDELDHVKFSHEDGIATWSEARKLPYLTAVIQEALRLHPALGLHLEIIVPASGLQVGQHFLPAGTIVGESA